MAQNWKDFVNARNKDIHTKYVVNPVTNLLEGLKNLKFLTEQDCSNTTAEDAWTICSALYNAKITSEERLNILVSIFIAAGQKPIADIIASYKGPFLKSNLRQPDATTAPTRLPVSQIVEATSTGQQAGVNQNGYFHRNTAAFQNPRSTGTQNTGRQGNSPGGTRISADYGQQQNMTCNRRPDSIKRNTATSTSTPTTFLYRNY